jgi:DNA-binding MarR family transcriptional regulator
MRSDKLDLKLCLSCHCLAARRQARELTRLYEAKLRPHGLKATQFSILVALAAAGPKPIGVLASTLGLERTTLTRGAALLARDGLVAEEQSEDSRERQLTLTGRGRRKLEAAYPAWKTAQEKVDKSLRLSSR